MYQLIKLEFKKYIRKPEVKLIIFALIIISTSLSFLDIKSYKTYDQSGNTIKGLKAIEYDELMDKSIDGVYSVKSSNKLLKNINKIQNDPKNKDDNSNNILGIKNSVYYKEIYPYKWIMKSLEHKRRVKDIKEELSKGNYEQLETLNKQANINENNYSPQIIKRVSDMYSLILDDWKLSRADGLGNNIYYFSLLYIYLSLFALILIISPIFSEEYEKGYISVVLSSKKGRSDLLYGKIIISILFIFIVFLASFLPMSLIYGWAYGFKGLDSNIQVFPKFIASPYNFNMAKLFGLTIILGIVGLFSLMGITLFVSSKSPNRKTTILIMLAIILLPQINLKSEPIFISKLRYLMPGMSLRMISHHNMMPSFYFLGNIVINPIIFIIVINLIVGNLFIYLSAKSFKVYQIK